MTKPKFKLGMAFSCTLPPDPATGLAAVVGYGHDIEDAQADARARRIDAYRMMRMREEFMRMMKWSEGAVMDDSSRAVLGGLADSFWLASAQELPPEPCRAERKDSR